MKHKFIVSALVIVLVGVVVFFVMGRGSDDAVVEKAVKKTAQEVKQVARRTTTESGTRKTSPPASPWNIRCRKDKQGNRKACEVFQLISVKETGERIAEFKIGFPKGKDKEAAGIIILPLGILLPSGVQMQIDEQKEAFKFAIRSCTPAGCFSHVTLTPEILEKMKKGSVANFQFKADNGRNVIIKLSLKGLTKAITVL